MPAYRRAGWNRRDSGVRRATLREDNALEAHCAYRYVGIAQTAYLRAGSRQAAGIRQGAGVAAGARRRLGAWAIEDLRSEEHTSELQSLMRISYAVFCLKKKK